MREDVRELGSDVVVQGGESGWLETLDVLVQSIHVDRERQVSLELDAEPEDEVPARFREPGELWRTSSCQSQAHPPARSRRPRKPRSSSSRTWSSVELVGTPTRCSLADVMCLRAGAIGPLDGTRQLDA